MYRPCIVAALSLSLLSAAPAMAAPTHDAWVKWADRANAVSDLISQGDSPTAAGQTSLQVRQVCAGADGQMTFGGYPRWAGMLAAVCDTLVAASNGERKKACRAMPRWVAEMEKGEPVPDEPRVDPARLRLIGLLKSGC